MTKLEEIYRLILEAPETELPYYTLSPNKRLMLIRDDIANIFIQISEKNKELWDHEYIWNGYNLYLTSTASYKLYYSHFIIISKNGATLSLVGNYNKILDAFIKDKILPIKRSLDNKHNLNIDV